MKPIQAAEKPYKIYRAMPAVETTGGRCARYGMSEEDLQPVLAGARCILWRATVTRIGKRLSWDFRMYHGGAAPIFIPSEAIDGQDYAAAWNKRKHPEDTKRMHVTAKTAIEGGEPGYTQEFRCTQLDGSVRWLREDVRITRMAPGLWDLVGVATDITDQKHAEFALRESEERNRTLLASLPQRVLFKDRNSTFISVNSHLANDLGSTPEDIAGKTDFDFFPKELAEKYVRDDRRVMETRTAESLEEINVVQGKARYVAVTKAPVIDDDGDVLGVLGLFEDITERKLMEGALRETEERFKAFMNHSPAIAFMKDDQGRYTYVNQKFEDVFDVSMPQLLGKTDYDWLPRDTAAELRENDSLVLGTLRTAEIIETVPTPDGVARHWLSFRFPIKDRSGHLYVGGVSIDITSREHSESCLRESEQRFREVFDKAAVGMAVVDTTGRVIQTNSALQRMLGYSDQELKKATFTSYTHPDDLASDLKLFSELLEGKRSSYQIEKRQCRKDGSVSWGHVTVSLVRSATNEPLFSIRMMEDITERKRFEEQIRIQMDQINRYSSALERQKVKLQRANSKLEALATTDGLTGLKNHRAFQERLAHEFLSATRSGRPFSLALVDVDNFKSFNDTFGHPAGDKVLKSVARILNKCARTTDLVARYGGEEFVLILDELGEERCRLVIERLRTAVEEAEWNLRPITISIGAATISPDAAEASHLIDYADQALYSSKARGRNRACHYIDLRGSENEERAA